MCTGTCVSNRCLVELASNQLQPEGIAVDALGPERVHSVAMPSRYTSQMSKEDAAKQAATLHVKHSEISIEGMFEATLAALKDEFEGLPAGTAEENIQSRCRGVLLMGISNKTGRMLLTKRRAVDFCRVATAICMAARHPGCR